MKVLSFNLKSKIVRIKITNQEDLWHLSKIIEPKDLISTISTRKIKLRGEGERAKAVKKPIRITLEVTRAEYTPNSLKCQGINKSEIEDIPLGSAHTIDLQKGLEIKLEKQNWHQYQIDRLREAEKSSVQPKALICVLDDESAHLGILNPGGIQEIGEIELGLAKKRLKEEAKKARLTNLAKELASLDKLHNPESIILASPLFWKDELLKEIKQATDLAKKVKLENIQSSGKRAFQELIGSGSLDKLMKKSRLQKENTIIEKLLAEIAKDSGLAAYGLKEVAKASALRAIETLLITDKIIEEFRSKDQYQLIENLIEKTEQNKGTVLIIPRNNEPGKKLQGLTGIAAILKFKVE